MTLKAVNHYPADGSSPCALCGQAAHVTMLDGNHLCAGCAPKIRRTDFNTFPRRAAWFLTAKREYPELPWWFLGWRLLQVEAHLLRNRLRP